MSFRVDFVGIGAGKCGSTWLHDNLVKHPEICDHNLKELNYFSFHYENHPLAWYEAQFASCQPELKKGEFSVTYLAHPEAPERIHRHFPEAKLLAIVRDPVKRTFSNYLHSIRKGDTAANQPFSDYIKEERHLIPSRYVEHLERFNEYFPPEQMFVIITEEFVKDPLAGYRSLYKFLGVNDVDFVPPRYDEVRNEARSYRFLWVENLLVRTYRKLSRSGYTKLVKKIVDSGVGESIRKLNRDSTSLPKIDESSKLKLADYFRPLDERLAKTLGRDLSYWYSQGHRDV